MPEAAAAPEESAPPPPKPGWYRNHGAVDLMVQPHNYPSAVLKPGDSTWLPDDPGHAEIKPCDAPDTDAADTPRSES